MDTKVIQVGDVVMLKNAGIPKGYFIFVWEIKSIDNQEQALINIPKAVARKLNLHLLGGKTDLVLLQSYDYAYVKLYSLTRLPNQNFGSDYDVLKNIIVNRKLDRDPRGFCLRELNFLNLLQEHIDQDAILKDLFPAISESIKNHRKYALRKDILNEASKEIALKMEGLAMANIKDELNCLYHVKAKRNIIETR